MPKKVHLIFTTHWDREWVQSFEQYRFRLVNLIDRMLDILEADPSLVFTFDGQTIVIEDYLEVRPEMQGRLRRLARGGRIVFGPWYVLADQFLEGPEAAVRNLLIGRGAAQQYGGAMREGYVPDSFGSIAALPALLSGFGINCANFGRGLAHLQERNKRLFCWAHADGSKVDVLAAGYGNFSALAGPEHWFEYEIDRANPERVRAKMSGYWEKNEKLFPGDHLYASVGADHFQMHPDTGEMVRILNEAGPCTWTASTPQRFMEEAFEDLRSKGIALERVEGEMRGDAESPMHLQGVLSTDIALKQKNRANEIFLGRVLEPLSAVYRSATGDTAQHVLSRAWKLLIRSHAHDSICACSRDGVMEDIHARMRNVRELYEIASERYLRRLVPQRRSAADARPHLLGFNTVPGRGTDAFSGVIRVPRKLEGDLFSIFDSGGCCVGTARKIGLRQADVETYYHTDRDLASLECKAPRDDKDRDVYTLLEVSGVAEFGASSGFSEFSLTPPNGGAPDVFKISDNSVSNGIIALSIASDGLLTMTETASGREWSGLGFFEDMADAGDTYDYGFLAGDRPLYSFEDAEVSVRYAGGDDYRSSIEVLHRWELPAGLDGCGRRERRERLPYWPTPREGRRKREKLLHEIRTVYTLYRGLDRVDAVTSFTNRSIQHRLRMGCRLAGRPRLTAGAHFMNMERDWAQLDDTFPCRPILDWIHIDSGLCILARGLYEMEPRRIGDDGELLLTLCRSTDTIGPAAGCNYDIEHAKALVHHSVEYAFAPAAQPLDACRRAISYTTPVIFEGFMKGDGCEPMNDLPGSLVSCSNPRIVMSACKRAEADDGLIVRFYNTSGSDQNADITFGLSYDEVVSTDLAENPIDHERPAEMAEQSVRISAGPHAIVTVKFTDARG